MLFVSAAFVLGEVKIYFDMFIPTQFMIIPLRFAYVNNNKIFLWSEAVKNSKTEAESAAKVIEQ